MSEENPAPPILTRELALREINRAALAIASNLSLEATLHQIVHSAREITGARYVALGEFNSAGQIETFITSGISEQEAARMDHEPEGLGLLGALMEEQRPIRIANIEADPRSIGFPEHHPPMTTFLGVPIMLGSSVLGNLYLTDKEGGLEFTEEDESLILLLSNHAAVAIENSHLYEASQERARELKARNRELSAVNTVARVTNEYLELGDMLEASVREILELTGMEAGEIFLLEPGSDTLTLLNHYGIEAGSFHTRTSFGVGEGFPGRVAQDGRAIATTDLSSDGSFMRPKVIEAGFQAYACFPIQFKGNVIGTLCLASKHPRAFDPRDLHLLEAIGRQLGVGIENANLYQELERLAILEERSRIGMDLHDGVIQSIYAVGLTLETIRLLFRDSPRQAEKLLDDAVEGLNAAIRDIRNFILDLRPRHFEGHLGEGLNRLVREFQANTMIGVQLDVPPKLVDSIPGEYGRAIFLTAQEALANIARHAKASNVSLAVDRKDGRVILTVRDDGRGFDPEQKSLAVGHGLANMKARADELNGQFEIESQPGQGTTVRLTLPPRE